jgi:hypothetical protein
MQDGDDSFKKYDLEPCHTPFYLFDRAIFVNIKMRMPLQESWQNEKEGTKNKEEIFGKEVCAA